MRPALLSQAIWRSGMPSEGPFPVAGDSTLGKADMIAPVDPRTVAPVHFRHLAPAPGREDDLFR
ncbi:hypothetical protein [Rhodovulum sulfidophilum]|uniref:hypothetical protein n=1 Tax=Rhodovulum sulfidophilum TaxID=35806 RepID=UPI001925CF2F|nr:hypothetical protein [Rhodovulum sulfidophilum]